jgi:hypothetical protein
MVPDIGGQIGRMEARPVPTLLDLPHKPINNIIL